CAELNSGQQETLFPIRHHLSLRQISESLTIDIRPSEDRKQCHSERYSHPTIDSMIEQFARRPGCASPSGLFAIGSIYENEIKFILKSERKFAAKLPIVCAKNMAMEQNNQTQFGTGCVESTSMGPFEAFKAGCGEKQQLFEIEEEVQNCVARIDVHRMATRMYFLSLVIFVSSAHYDTACSDCDNTQSLVLNFHQPEAYVAFKLDHRSKLLHQLEFEMLTQKINSQLLSLRSAIRNRDSISMIDLNVKSGSLYFHIESESGIWQSHSDLTIPQGVWCSVKLNFTSACLEVTIDGENEQLFSGSPVVPMLGKYFVVNFADDSQFAGKSAPKPYNGCLRRLILNNQPLPKNQILTSRDLEYDCNCESDILNETKNNNCPKRSNRDDELISDENLSYKRGAVLSSMEKDYGTITVEEGGIEKPQNGHLVMDGSKSSLDNFTMQDVSKGKISYKHDGSETIDDVIEIEGRPL
uniref:Laminin G domain-containing protein n=1 Tax=Romanomermis culicivorax TaxID=13658 RepID=A0A915ILJ7_ROMCU